MSKEKHIELPTEEWRDINGYEGDYQISNLGNVKSLKRENECMLTPYIQKHEKGNYKKVRVTLHKNGVSRKYFIHVLVAKAFMENYDDSLEIHHINFNSSDNRLCNLIQLTKEEHRELHKNSLITKNNRSRWQIGSNNPMYGKTGSSSPTSKRICAFKDGFYKEYCSLKECAEDLGIPNTCRISGVLNGTHRTTHGFGFTYL